VDEVHGDNCKQILQFRYHMCYQTSQNPYNPTDCPTQCKALQFCKCKLRFLQRLVLHLIICLRLLEIGEPASQVDTIGKQNYQELGVEAELNFELFEFYQYIF